MSAVLRRSRAWALVFSTGSALVLGWSLAYARSAEAPSVPSDSEPEEFRAADAAGLTQGQLTLLADEYIQHITKLLSDLRTLYASARDDKDVVKTLCLNDKIEQLQTAVETTTDRRATLAEALEGGGLERARHEFTLIGVLAERASALATEANQCIGDETTFTEDDESVLDLTVSGVLPNVNADTVEIPPVILAAPAVKSPVD